MTYIFVRGHTEGMAKAIISPTTPLVDCPLICWEQSSTSQELSGQSSIGLGGEIIALTPGKSTVGWKMAVLTSVLKTPSAQKLWFRPRKEGVQDAGGNYTTSQEKFHANNILKILFKVSLHEKFSARRK